MRAATACTTLGTISARLFLSSAALRQAKDGREGGGEGVADAGRMGAAAGAHSYRPVLCQNTRPALLALVALVSASQSCTEKFLCFDIKVNAVCGACEVLEP